jgi:hypothetical protein
MEICLKKLAARLLTNTDLDTLLFGKVPVVPYHELSKIFNINELFTKGNRAIIMVYEYKENSGHYCAVLDHKDHYEFFDPYGTKNVDSELQYSNFDFPYMKGHEFYQHSLLKLLDMSKHNGKPYVCSPHKLQSENKTHKDWEDNTCGRWCATRIRMGGVKLKSFADLFIPLNKKESGGASLAVVAMTMLDVEF